MEWELLSRVLIAGLCGAAIGFERKSRFKEAGMRTHFIVALGSAMVMVVSMYAFLGLSGPSIRVDPGRIAAQVVSGIGFLGAGTIIVQRQSIRGLTTAAGLWTTAGIGLAIGAGMYILGLGGTILTIVGLEILDRGGNFLPFSNRQLSIRVADREGILRRITTVCEQADVEITRFQVVQPEPGSDGRDLVLKLLIRGRGLRRLDQVLDALRTMDEVVYARLE